MEECDGTSVKEDIFFFPKSLNFLFVFILCVLGLFEYIMDTDERFCDKFSDLDGALKADQADIISFYFVHIWDKSGDIYNGEYPFSNNGIVERVKMFRNFGHCQINTLKERMHFVVIPHQQNISKSNILYKHFGMDSEYKRICKYSLYQKEDIAKDQISYEHIIKHEPTQLNFNDIEYVNGRFLNPNIK